ncbi:MAG: PIN/TRAM domain-containing protein [bacterium]
MSEPAIDRLPESAETSARFINPRQRSTKLILLAARLMFMALVLATPALVVGSQNDGNTFPISLVVGLTLASGSLGLIVVVIDSMSPNKQLASIFGIYLGICLGLIGAYAIGTLLDTIVAAWSLQDSQAALYLNLIKVSIGLILCYIAVSVVMTTKDDFRLVIPYVEFSKQNRGVRPMLLDTSAVIDGRIHDLAQSGAIDAPFVVLQAVIDELQRLADSSDKGKRARGRRGLDMIARLQGAPRIDLSIEDLGFEGANVDRGLVEVAKRNAYRLITTDTALAKVAEIAGVPAVNINTLAGSLRAQMLPGDRIEVELTKAGENPSQGVGYLPDGTMVVVEAGAAHIGGTVHAVVTNTLTTNAGRMVFARHDPGDPPPSGSAESMASQATGQPKYRGDAPQRFGEGPDSRGSGRNPRRG